MTIDERHIFYDTAYYNNNTGKPVTSTFYPCHKNVTMYAANMELVTTHKSFDGIITGCEQCNR